MAETKIEVSATVPGEKIVVELIGLIRDIVQGQPPEVKKELWQMYLEDVKAWREFWKKIGN